MDKKRVTFHSLIIALITITFSSIGYKLYVLDYPLSALIPVVGYDLELTMEVDGHGESVNVSTYLPQNDDRQTITEETLSTGAFVTQVNQEYGNRIVSWTNDALSGHHTLSYKAFIKAQHTIYTLDENLTIPKKYPSYLAKYLRDEEGINSKHPLIKEEIKRLFGDKEPKLKEALTIIHRHLQDDFANKNFSGFTDSITALKLKEASCNGKSRLFVAFLRALNIPSRLVGGVILNNGSKRTSHQWIQAYIEGYWVPFDTINDHFMQIPANFLTLYYGDKVLFAHTPNINFQYNYRMDKKLVSNTSSKEKLSSSSLSGFNFYAIFERIGISQNLLKIILMIPIGALVIVIFRNVIGIETFGTFLPALMATAARETGLFWGLVSFMLIIMIAAMVRRLLDWIGLLHSPKMAIMLTFVVITLLTLTVVGVNHKLFDLAHVSLFPIAILAITAERFAIIEAEEGLKRALKLSMTTMLVIAAAYTIMDATFMQSLFVAFPELLLLVIVLNLWLGKWVGIRLNEYIRFRKLIFKKNP